MSNDVKPIEIPVKADISALEAQFRQAEQAVTPLTNALKSLNEQLRELVGLGKDGVRALAPLIRAMREEGEEAERAKKKIKEKSEGAKELQSVLRPLTIAQHQAIQASKLDEEQTLKNVRVGKVWWQTTLDKADGLKLLGQAYNTALTPAQKTELLLDRLSRETDDRTKKTYAYAKAVENLTARLADQQRRESANRGRSLSMLKDEVEDLVRSMVPFGGMIMNVKQHFTNLGQIITEHGGSVRDIAREYAESGKALKVVGAAGTEAAGGVSAAGGAMALLLHPAVITAATLGALSIGLVAAGSHAAPFVKDLRDLENTLGLVGNQSETARAQMEALENKALSAANLGIGPREAADAMGQLASLGLNATDTLKAFEPVAMLAKARNLDMGTAAKIAGAQMAVFGTSVDDLGVELDKLSVISNLTGVQAGDLQMMMAKAGKGAIAAGQDFNSIAIAAGLARNAGIAMEEVMSGIGSGLLQISSKGRSAFTAMTHGKDVVDATTGKFRPLEQILLDVADATRGMNDADKAARIEKVFGREALTAILPVMKQLTDGIKDQSGATIKGAEAAAYIREKLENAGGANKRFADNLQNTLQGQQEKFNALVDAVTTGIGTKIEPALKSLYSVANSVLEVINDIFSPAKTVDPMRARFDDLTKKAEELGAEVERIRKLPFYEQSNHSSTIALYEETIRKLREVKGELAAANSAQQKAGAQTAEQLAAQAAATAELSKKEKDALERVRDAYNAAHLATLEGKARIREAMRQELADIDREVAKNQEAGLKDARIYDFLNRQKVEVRKKFAKELAEYEADLAKKKEADQKKEQEALDKLRQAVESYTKKGLAPMVRAQQDHAAALAAIEAAYAGGAFGTGQEAIDRRTQAVQEANDTLAASKREIYGVAAAEQELTRIMEMGGSELQRLELQYRKNLQALDSYREKALALATTDEERAAVQAKYDAGLQHLNETYGAQIEATVKVERAADRYATTLAKVAGIADALGLDSLAGLVTQIDKVASAEGFEQLVAGMELAETAAGAVTQAFAAIGRATVSAFQQAWGAITSGVSLVMGLIDRMMGQLQLIGGDGKLQTGLGLKDMLGLGDGAKGVLQTAIDRADFSGMLSKLAKGFAATLEGIASRADVLLVDVLDGVKAGLGTMLDRAVPAFMDIVSSLVRAVVQALPGLVSQLAGALGTFVTNDLPDLLEQAAGALVQVMDVVIAQVLPALGYAASGVLQALIANMPAIIAKLFEVAVAVLETFASDVAPFLGTLAVTLIDAVLAALPTLIPALLDAGTAVVLGLIQAVPQLIASLLQYVPVIVTELVVGLVANIGLIVLEFVKHIPTIVVALATGLAAMFMQFAAMLMEALGFDGAAETIRTASETMVREAVSATQASITGSGSSAAGAPGGTAQANSGAATYKTPDDPENEDMEVSDGFLPSTGSSTTVKTAPGDAAWFYQDGGPNDPVAAIKRGNGLLGVLAGLLVEIRDTLADIKSQRSLRASPVSPGNGARALK